MAQGCWPSSKEHSSETTASCRVSSRLQGYGIAFWNGTVAALVTVVALLLFSGLQGVQTMLGCPFPAQMLGMLLVFVVFLVSGWVKPGVETFYVNHLKMPARTLNKHMSIGFAIPFLKIIGKPTTDWKSIGIITACFGARGKVLTGIINTAGAYILAYPLQRLITHMPRLVIRRRLADEESNPRHASLAFSRHKPSTKAVSEVSSMTSIQCLGLDTRADQPEASPTDAPRQEDAHRAVVPQELLVPTTCVFWMLTILVGLPTRFALNTETPLGVLLLGSIWLSTVAFQECAKSAKTPRLAALLAGIFNPVLWTSLAMMAFVKAESARSSRSVTAVLDTIQTNVSFADVLFKRQPDSPDTLGTLATGMGAGDMALAILNAGLVAWGLKLYECRRQLLSRAGVTVMLVSSVAAVANVACGPVLASAMGMSDPHDALAFAARSVTISLGVPALTILQGDLGLNAVMVVTNGILFQMAMAFGAGACISRTASATMLCFGRPAGVDASKAARSSKPSHSAAPTTPASIHDPQIVATGVMIGINSAAMGTAYLYEADHPAAPFSALSMTALGLMTVVFASIHPLAGWIDRTVGL